MMSSKPADTGASLPPMQARFVEEYLIDLNAKAAAIRAGYSAKTAEQQGYQLLQKPLVAAAIEAGQKKLARRHDITKDKIVAELAKIGFSDIRKVVNWRANVTAMIEDPDTGESRMAVTNEVALIGSEEIDDATAGAIAEVSQTDRGGLKVKLYDKRAALVDLAKMLGHIVEKHEVTGKDGGPIRTEQVSARDILAGKLARLAGSRTTPGGTGKPD